MLCLVERTLGATSHNAGRPQNRPNHDRIFLSSTRRVGSQDEEMSSDIVRTLDEKIAALFRKGSPIFAGAELAAAPSVNRQIGEEAASEAAESEPAGGKGNATTRVDDKATLVSQGTVAEQPSSPLWGLDLDAAIRLRWTLRDIKAKRSKLLPPTSDDLKRLTELGLIEMRDEVPELTNEGHRALGWS
jgi:hypothetical protein